VILWELATEKIPWDNLNPMQVLLSCINTTYKTRRLQTYWTKSHCQNNVFLNIGESLTFG